MFSVTLYKLLSTGLYNHVPYFLLDIICLKYLNIGVFYQNKDTGHC